MYANNSFIIDPIAVKMTRTEKKRRGTVYAVNTNIRSSPFTCSVASTISSKKNGLTSVKTTVDYKIAKLGKDKVILTGKFRDRSTRAYTKYTMDRCVLPSSSFHHSALFFLDRTRGLCRLSFLLMTEKN